MTGFYMNATLGWNGLNEKNAIAKKFYDDDDNNAHDDK